MKRSRQVRSRVGARAAIARPRQTRPTRCTYRSASRQRCTRAGTETKARDRRFDSGALGRLPLSASALLGWRRGTSASTLEARRDDCDDFVERFEIACRGRTAVGAGPKRRCGIDGVHPALGQADRRARALSWHRVGRRGQGVSVRGMRESGRLSVGAQGAGSGPAGGCAAHVDDQAQDSCPQRQGRRGQGALRP